jgi:hypothetical protein
MSEVFTVSKKLCTSDDLREYAISLQLTILARSPFSYFHDRCSTLIKAELSSKLSSRPYLLDLILKMLRGSYSVQRFDYINSLLENQWPEPVYLEHYIRKEDDLRLMHPEFLFGFYKSVFFDDRNPLIISKLDVYTEIIMQMAVHQ